MDKIEYSRSVTLKLPDGCFITGKGDTIAQVEQALGEDRILHDNLENNTTAPSTTPQVHVEEPVEEEPKEYWVNIVKKESPNKGRHFKSEKGTGKFLGWTDEPLTTNYKE